MPTAFAQTVEARFAGLTPTAKRVASYMLANLERLGLETADQIAQQTGTSGISVGRFLRSIGYSYLEYIRPRVFYSDGMSGSYVDSLNSEFASPYLIITDTRAYSRIARQYCEAATRRGLPFALVTDLYCPWARDFPCDLLQVKTDVGQFWDSLAPLTCLFNLLITSIVERLGPTIDERVARNRELQRELDQFDL